jgi:hypothetical protein
MPVAGSPAEVPFLNVVDPKFDFTSPEVMAAQAQSWYAETPLGLLVLRYAEVAELLRDRRLDHNGKRFMEETCGVSGGPIYDWYVPMIVNQDGEDHLRVRRLVSKVFTPRMIDRLRPFIRAKAEELTDRIAAAGECEFVEDFGNPLPLGVMCHMLGVPAEDYDTFRAWTSDIGLVFSLPHGGDEMRAQVEAAVVGLSGYADYLIKLKEAEPADDLISALVHTRDTSDKISDAELRNMVVTLVFGAHDTTRAQLGNAMAAFASHPLQWDALTARPELGEQAADEAVRWCPAANVLNRYAAEDFVYHDLPIAQGTFLLACAASAQRDPRVFPDGDVFDITVPRQDSGLQFGAGPHHCLGTALARAEVGEALSMLASKLGPPHIAGEVIWRPAIGIYGPDQLPLSFG